MANLVSVICPLRTTHNPKGLLEEKRYLLTRMKVYDILKLEE